MVLAEEANHALSRVQGVDAFPDSCTCVTRVAGAQKGGARHHRPAHRRRCYRHPRLRPEQLPRLSKRDGASKAVRARRCAYKEGSARGTHSRSTTPETGRGVSRDTFPGHVRWRASWAWRDERERREDRSSRRRGHMRAYACQPRSMILMTAVTAARASGAAAGANRAARSCRKRSESGGRRGA